MESFFGIGGPELLLIFILATIILGPLRMISAARTMGRLARDLRNYYTELTRGLNEELAALSELEASVRSEVTAAIPTPEELQILPPVQAIEARSEPEVTSPVQPVTAAMPTAEEPQILPPTQAIEAQSQLEVAPPVQAESSASESPGMAEDPSI